MATNVPPDVLGRSSRRRSPANKFGVAPPDQRRHPRTNELFASKAELRRWLELELLQRAGEISGLRRQIHYQLNVPARWEVLPDGTQLGVLPHKVGTYVADHVYKNAAGDLVVEDVKGFRTPEYKLKRELMKALYGITIFEFTPPK